MSLARIAAQRGAYAVAVALDTDHRLYTEYVVALNRAWRRRQRPTDAERIWLGVPACLPFELAEELYGHAVARGLHDAAQALAAGIASQYPEVR